MIYKPSPHIHWQSQITLSRLHAQNEFLKSRLQERSQLCTEIIFTPCVGVHVCTDHAWAPAETKHYYSTQGTENHNFQPIKIAQSEFILSWQSTSGKHFCMDCRSSTVFISITFPPIFPSACSLSEALHSSSALKIVQLSVLLFQPSDTTYHLLDPVKGFPMKTESLFKQDLVFHCPLIWEWSEVWQIRQRFLNVVLVPKQHPKSLEIIRTP